MNGKKISRNIKSSLQLFWAKFGGAIIGIAVLAIIIYLILTLNIFYVQKFEIESFDREELVYLNEEEISDFLTEYIGTRLFELNVAEVEQKLIDEFSFIKNVYVSKRAPNSISVKIVERVPTLALVKDKIFYLLDDEGMVLGLCDEYEKYCKNIPSVSVLNYKGDIEIGSVPFITEIDEVIQLAESERKMGLNIIDFLIPDSDVISITFSDVTRGIFSTGKDINEQIETYMYTRENLLLEDRKFKEIDLRFDRPVIRVDKYTY